jgi:hypothetical protein
MLKPELESLANSSGNNLGSSKNKNFHWQALFLMFHGIFCISLMNYLITTRFVKIEAGIVTLQDNVSSQR